MIDHVVLKGSGPHDLPVVESIRFDSSEDGETIILTASFFNTDTQKMDMMHIRMASALVQDLYDEIPPVLKEVTNRRNA